MEFVDYPRISFINIDDVNQFIEEKPILYKYMPLEHALTTLKKKEFWLSNPSCWPDPFENRFLNAQYVDKNGKELDFPFLNRTFATCLTREPSSEAQWNAYSKDSIAIQFFIDTKQLLKQLSNYANKNSFHVYFGKVEHHKRNEIKVNNINQLLFEAEKNNGEKIKKDIKTFDFCARLFLLKRRDFKYEDEVRIIVFKNDKPKNNTTPTGTQFNYTCDNKELIRKIRISPKAKAPIVEMLKEYISEKYDMHPQKDKSGRKQPLVLQSHLYDEETAVKISI